MVISKYILKAEYNKFQYVGAFIVAGGIIVVLAPSLSGGGDVMWSIIMIASCIPMALSSVYKVSGGSLYFSVKWHDFGTRRNLHSAKLSWTPCT
jgi:hypothetical protein